MYVVPTHLAPTRFAHGIMHLVTQSDISAFHPVGTGIPIHLVATGLLLPVSVPTYLSNADLVPTRLLVSAGRTNWKPGAVPTRSPTRYQLGIPTGTLGTVPSWAYQLVALVRYQLARRLDTSWAYQLVVLVRYQLARRLGTS